MKTRVWTSLAFALSAAMGLYAGCGSDEGSAFPDGDASARSDAGGGASSSGSSGTSGITSGGVPGEGGAGTQKPTPVDVVFTADNAYKFGWGTVDRLDQVEGRPFSTNAGDIFNCGTGPEAYTVPADAAPLDAYLYVVAWDDRAVTQGALGQFKRRETEAVLYTGDPAWEVCATGLPFPAADSTAQGPDTATINAEIERCTAGTGDKEKTSGGWVSAAGAVTPGAVGALVVGEDNSAADGDFPITCLPNDAGQPGIDSAAKWMWYSPDGANAFRNNETNRTRAFLIFRLTARALPPPVIN